MDDGDRTYDILYRLQDSAGNISESPILVNILYDNNPPTINSVLPLEGTTFISEAEGYVALLISAEDRNLADTHDGVGIQYIKFSNDSDLSDDDWEEWAPIKNDWQLDIGDGSVAYNGVKTVYFSILDYLNNEPAAPTTLNLTWDTDPPQISFDTAHALEVRQGTSQPGNFSDNIGIATFLWEKESGPGSITFSDNGVQSPIVSANTDGIYILKVTAADGAGNAATSSVPFIWDTDPPAAMTSLSTSGTYSTVKRPTVSWTPVSGADTYEVEIYDGSMVLQESALIDLTSYTPASDLPEGSVSFEVTPFDNAGNSSTTESAVIFIDTVPPVISNDGQLFLRNFSGIIDYTGPDGTVTEGGSGTATILWEKTSGPGTISFSDNSILDPVVSASAHGYYGMRLTVTDIAGNSTVANFTLNWDIVPPNAPSVTGIDRTPNVQPTWFWNTGGNGGTGYYRFTMQRADGNDVVVAGPQTVYDSWSADVTQTSFSPFEDGHSLPADPPPEDFVNQDEYTYLLYVQEKDEAGNWSASGVHPIWVDGAYTAPPEVTVEGASYRNTTDIVWNWSSGAAQPSGTTTYRYRINGGSWVPDSDGDTIETTGIFDSGVLDGEDKNFTIEVEEYYTAGPYWIDKLGSHTVRVDRMGPVAPAVSNITATPTRDSTPTWSWSSNAGTDGTGIFRYQLDAGGWSSATTTTVYTAPTQSHGSHTLYVQEQDALGNWGDPGSFTIDVDIQAPVLTSISLNGGDGYTYSTTVNATIDAVSEPGMQMSFYDYNPSGWKPWETYSPSKTIYLPTGEGSKRVYVRVQDSLGNVSSYVYDEITVDQTAPTNGSLLINGGDTYTPSLDAVLTVSATDNYATQNELQVRYYYNGTWSSWQAFSSQFTANTNFTPIAGAKGVYVQFRDPAGNTTGSIYDSIYLQMALPTYAYKGNYTSGTVRVYFNPVTEPSGSFTNRYYIYSSTDPSADPNGGDGVTYEGYTTSTSYASVAVPKGELRYFWVRAYNADTGGFGPYSNINVLGFSSNVTIIYDDDESADIARANALKAIIEDDADITSNPLIVGTMPTWTVTLLPEDLIPNSYSTQNMIYGDPIIITHGSTFSTASSYDDRVRNIASSSKGTIAMGSGGAYFIYRVDQNWGGWGLSGTRPSDIDSGNHMILTATKDTKTRPYSTSESIWFTPLYYTVLYPAYQNNSMLVNIFGSDVGRRGVYRSDQSNPVDGNIYAGDKNFCQPLPRGPSGRVLLLRILRSSHDRCYGESILHQYCRPDGQLLIPQDDSAPFLSRNGASFIATSIRLQCANFRLAFWLQKDYIEICRISVCLLFIFVFTRPN